MTVPAPSRAEAARVDLRTAPPVHDRLLAAAKDLFAAEGYDNATTAAIARRAGTSESQLIKHFGSKEGLLEAIFDRAWARLEDGVRDVIQRTGSALERLLALWELVVASFERDRKLRTLILLESRRVRKRSPEVVLSSGFRRFLGHLDTAFLEMHSNGQVKGRPPLEAVRSAWLGATEGLLRDQMLAEVMDFPGGYDARDVREASRQVLAGFLTPAGRRLLAKT